MVKLRRDTPSGVSAVGAIRTPTDIPEGCPYGVCIKLKQNNKSEFETTVSVFRQFEAGTAIPAFVNYISSITFLILSIDRSLPRICMTVYRSGEFVLPVTA